MSAASLVPYGAMLAAGLLGSLHCIGMCGPLLIAFASALGDEGRGGRFVAQAAYHLGRIWTYGLLGLIAGLLGSRLSEGAAIAGWQRPASFVLGGLVVVAGVALLAAPWLGLGRLVEGCGLERLRAIGPLRALIGDGRPLARLLLGAIMGFLPCGLVYAMLVTVAASASPLGGALGMIVFGVGTVPSLAVALGSLRLLPARVRVHGTRIAAVGILVAGAWMVARALTVVPGATDGPCAACGVAGER